VLQKEPERFLRRSLFGDEVPAESSPLRGYLVLKGGQGRNGEIRFVDLQIVAAGCEQKKLETLRAIGGGCVSLSGLMVG